VFVRRGSQYGFFIPLPEAGESIAPFFFCMLFCVASGIVPIVFAPDAPDGAAVVPLEFGVPMPVPP
jgi:hypothetical protein